MPELKRLFTSGKMQKDLDERLVPPGQYRDALNIQISDSDGSDAGIGDVGAIESVVGNTKQVKKSSSVNWSDRFGLGTEAVCIGVCRDTLNNKVYWFITSNTVDAIMEYDEATQFIAPVLVDARTGSSAVLNFSASNLITGVNIVEGILFFTDDLNEPRRINIDRFKAGSTQTGQTLTATTQVYRAAAEPPASGFLTRLFTADDIAVAKKAPEQAITVSAVASVQGGNATGIDPEPVNANFYNKSAGDTIALTWSNQVSWHNNSGTVEIVLTAEKRNEDGSLEKFQVVGTVQSSPTPTPTAVTISITLISENIPNETVTWDMLLIEREPIFKNDFPRFSYRYKFVDGEYSPFAPFSKGAFVPGEFKYLSRDGNNIGMESVIRKITLTNFQSTPPDVDEVEVLYKGASSNNVYLIHSFQHAPSAVTQVLSLDITSGTLGRIIESSQLLRLFDPVPRKAKAQELIGNRVVYANYLENYNIKNSSVRITADQTNSNHGAGNFGEETVKSDREYQIGVSFIDDFGRESPIFTSSTGSVTIDSSQSAKANVLKAKLDSFNPPTGISKFKYYVKNNSAEYYNIALDRYYDAGDGGVWLSFPSSERNKLQEGQYIILKKQHDSHIPVTLNNKYKINALSNEVPSSVNQIGEVVANVLSYAWAPVGDEGFIVGNKSIKFWSEERQLNPPYFDGFVNGAQLYFQTKNSLAKTDKYTVFSGGPLLTSAPITKNSKQYVPYEIILETPIRQEDAWLDELPDEEPFIVILENIKELNLPEFTGRFFTKILPNATFFNSFPAEFNSSLVEYIEDKRLVLSTSGQFTTLGQNNAIPRLTWKDEFQSLSYPSTSNYPPTSGTTNGGLKANQNNFNIYLQTGVSAFVNSFWESLTTPGVKIKFLDAQGAVISDEFYTVIKVENTAGTYGQTNVYTRFDPSQVPIGNNGVWAKITLDRPWDDLALDYQPGIAIYREKIKVLTTVLSSTNPAVFETEPLELADLDLYFEASNAINISNRASFQDLKFVNAYSFGNGVESDRIRDDFNAPTIGNGVRVNSTLDEPYNEERRGSGLIYSGIFNSRSGVNNTNQFLIAEKITKDLNPIYGSIQKLYARDTDLIVLLEDKVFRVLANKDALFNADGNPQLISSNRVLGQAVPYVGDYGISKNPESFANYGFRSYFTDKSRGAVIRLSRDGITDVSGKGMSNFILEAYKNHGNNKIIGSYDEDAGSYNISVNSESLSFKENVDGWATRLSYQPEMGVSLNNEYYTFNKGEIWKHDDKTTRSRFYSTQNDTTVTLIYNDAPSRIKNFKTLSYEGDDGWTAVVATDQQDGEVLTWKNKEGIYYNYLRGLATTWDNSNQSGTLDTSEFHVQGLSNLQSATTWNNNGTCVIRFSEELNATLHPAADDVIFYKDSQNGNVYKLGTITATGKDGDFFTITFTNSSGIGYAGSGTGTAPIVQIGEYFFFVKNSNINTSGIIGYYAEVKMTKTGGTNKELFAVNSEIFISS